MTTPVLLTVLYALIIQLFSFASSLTASAPDSSLNPITGILEPPNNDKPVITPRDTFISKRAAGPIVYLSNCRGFQPPYLSLIPPPYTRSAIFSYPERAATLHGEIPSMQDAVNVGTGVIQWEGLMINAPFPSGEIFTSYIDADAWSRPDFSYAGFGDVNGSGTDGYRYGFVGFSCFKDNERELFRTGTNNACFSIYYCLAQ